MVGKHDDMSPWLGRRHTDASEHEALDTIERLLDEVEEIAIWLAPDSGLGYGHVHEVWWRRFQAWKLERATALRVEVAARPYRDQKQKISRGLAKRVMERDAYRCQHCGTWRNLTVDHIIPESKGGTLDFDNLQTLCQSCNSKKGTR